MNVTVFSPQSAAHVLLQAERGGALLAALPDTARPADLLQGYDIQDAVIAARGTPRAGWKLGVGSPAQLKANDLHRPLIGQLAAERCHGNGAQLRMPTADPVTIECEIAFVLARDIPPERGRAPSAADVKHACVTLPAVQHQRPGARDPCDVCRRRTTRRANVIRTASHGSYCWHKPLAQSTKPRILTDTGLHGNKCLTMTYFHRRPSTIIGA
ncbi:hypothetical protein IMZ29_01595, partial [Achromobacter sp. GG226]|nr:hypothetical protein [Verticiella sp. GG226]